MSREDLSKASQILYDNFTKDFNEIFKHNIDHSGLAQTLISDLDALVETIIKERDAIIESLGTFYLIKNNGLQTIYYYIKFEGCPKIQIEQYEFNILSPFAYQIIESSYGNKIAKNNMFNPNSYEFICDEYEKKKKWRN